MNKILAAAAALVLAPMAGVAVSAPAAAAADEDCPAHSFCLYPTSGYREGQFVMPDGEGCWNLRGSIDNNANAMRNYTDRTIVLWDFPGCTGNRTYTLKPQSFDNNFDNNDFTNKASSYKRI